MKKSQPAYFVPALEKGLDILEALSVSSTPQNLAQLARTCNRTGSEIFRMVDALEKRAYIVRDPISGGYELTLKLFQLAHTHSPVDHLLKAAHFPMQDLATALHESCHLCVLADRQLLVVAAAESPDPVRLSVEIGHRASPLSTVSGRVLIAELDEPARSRLLQSDEVYMDLSSVRRSALHRELAQIRHDHFHVAPSSVSNGIDISCLIGSAEIGAMAALGVPFLSGGRNEGKERSLIPVIQKHAKRITQALGLEFRPAGRST